jgi:hypothetical protein
MPGMREARSVAVVVLALLLVSCVSVSQAGMSQGGLLFRSKEAAPAAAGMPMGSPGGAGGPPTESNMQWYAADNAAAQAFRPTPVPIARESTTIKLTLTAKYGDEEDKELRRYEATFESKYVIRCKEKPAKPKAGRKAEDKQIEIVVFFPFPGSADTVPDAKLQVNGKEPEDVRYTQDGVSCELTFKPQEKKEVTVSYRAFGTEDFVYMLDHGERIKALDFAATIQGTQRKPQLPAKECLEPTAALTREGDTYTVAWSHQDLLTKRDIIVKIPAPIVGGDIAQRMPNLLRTGIVSLVLLGLLLGSGGLIVGRRLTLGQYVLIALPVIVFYPLFLQLSKYVSVYLAFGLAFVLMGLLVLDNLHRNQGARFALTYGLFGLVTIVGLFSIAALLTKGAGTLITIASFILIAYVMHAVPKLPAILPRRPSRVIPRPPTPPPAESDEGEDTTEAPVMPVVAPMTAVAPPVKRQYCAHCGRAVEEGFAFCPGCGKEAHVAHQCGHCGADLCNECSADYRYCPGCGRQLPTP